MVCKKTLYQPGSRTKKKFQTDWKKEATLSDKNWEQIALKWWTNLFSIGS